MTLWNLFVAFARANLLGYGGGPSVIPLMKAEVVDTFGWVTNDEFASALAVGNSLPGPIAPKMSAYIGYKVSGGMGALVSVIGTVLPTALLMIALAALLMRYQNHPVVAGMIKAVKAVVFALFVQLAFDFFRFAWPATAGWVPALIGAGALVALLAFHVHQALVVLAAMVIGGVLLR